MPQPFDSPKSFELVKKAEIDLSQPNSANTNTIEQPSISKSEQSFTSSSISEKRYVNSNESTSQPSCITSITPTQAFTNTLISYNRYANPGQNPPHTFLNNPSQSYTTSVSQSSIITSTNPTQSFTNTSISENTYVNPDQNPPQPAPNNQSQSYTTSVSGSTYISSNQMPSQSSYTTTNITQTTDFETAGGGGLPEGYKPVKPLSPLKPSDLEPSFNVHSELSSYKETNSSSVAEIKEENIKSTLKEIILDLDKYAEKDKELQGAGEDAKFEPPDFGMSLLRQVQDTQVSFVLLIFLK